ncbi:MAG: hypothetical protein EBT71_08165 [Alphaproteobacteria bacterium]|nr:hypothetical protein [Alphaproteobacteria bacterium]
MMLPDRHPDIAYGKTGLLLVNLGTPQSPDAKGLRPYLAQFLSDRRVIETSPLIWQPILRAIILNTRPRKSARAYAKIWRQETNESPLRYYTRTQAEAVQDALGEGIIVDWAMRYGAPSIAERLQAMKERGCERIAIVALYPQYSASTSASVYDEMVEFFELPGPAEVTLAVNEAHRGSIRISTLEISQFPWHGKYMQGVPVTLEAVALPGYRFAGWNDPDVMGDRPTATITLSGSNEIKAFFERQP